MSDPLNETRRELIKLLTGATSMPATQLVRLIEQLIECKIAERAVTGDTRVTARQAAEGMRDLLKDT